jgi:Na+/H+ antiporter NhaD/arsenite permease-like protein
MWRGEPCHDVRNPYRKSYTLRIPWDLTPVGSLATILWLLILRQRNIEVSGLDYFKVGILVTPLMLVIGAFAIWLLLV